MRHPFEAVPRGQRAKVFLPLLGLTLALTAALGWVDIPLRTASSPNGIVSFEVAGDVATAGRMLAAWDERARIHAGFSLGLDFLYLVVYSTTLAFACVWAGTVFRGRGSRLAELAAPLAWAQWLAALSDASENTALLLILRGAVVEPWPAIARWCATTKFAFIIAGLFYALAGAAVRLATRSRPAA